MHLDWLHIVLFKNNSASKTASLSAAHFFEATSDCNESAKMLSLHIFFNSRKKVQVNIMLCVVVVDDPITFKNNRFPKNSRLID